MPLGYKSLSLYRLPIRSLLSTYMLRNPSTALRTFTSRRDQLVISGQYMKVEQFLRTLNSWSYHVKKPVNVSMRSVLQSAHSPLRPTSTC